jgi:exosome complex RNA-binding protein Rrp42 (RNase PH superfamily)
VRPVSRSNFSNQPQGVDYRATIVMASSDISVIQQLDPVGYFRKFVKNGVRVDGRGFLDLRCVAVGGGDFSTSSGYGSSLVHIGETKVACSISVLVGTPSQLFPASGDIGTLIIERSWCDNH